MELQDFNPKPQVHVFTPAYFDRPGPDKPKCLYFFGGCTLREGVCQYRGEDRSQCQLCKHYEGCND